MSAPASGSDSPRRSRLPGRLAPSADCRASGERVRSSAGGSAGPEFRSDAPISRRGGHGDGIEASGRRRRRPVLLDCGLFQGLKQLRGGTGSRSPSTPLDRRGLVSHAHLDHSGALPLLVKPGFRGPIYCTPATEGPARPSSSSTPPTSRKKTPGTRIATAYSKHSPALPLYTTDDAQSRARPIESVALRRDVSGDVRRRRDFAGRATSSAPPDVTLQLGRGSRPAGLVFSGDLGRFGPPDPPRSGAFPEADVLLVESTYGDRLHRATRTAPALARTR